MQTTLMAVMTDSVGLRNNMPVQKVVLQILLAQTIDYTIS